MPISIPVSAKVHERKMNASHEGAVTWLGQPADMRTLNEASEG
jgi:hypothetical protein